MTTPDNARVHHLRRDLRIVPADITAWRALQEFHYRSSRPGAIDKIFAIRRTPPPHESPLRARLHRHPVGVIIYTMPVANVALRNLATDNRYVGLGDPALTLRALNAELRCISRVVIHPQWRGIGLARWLVQQTLPLAGTVMVEALAVMGRVNPFFARAGMSPYHKPISPHAQRLLAAAESLDIPPHHWGDPRTIKHHLDNLPASQQQFLRTELARFADVYLRRCRNPDLDRQLHLASVHVLSNPVYYLWRKP